MKQYIVVIDWRAREFLRRNRDVLEEGNVDDKRIVVVNDYAHFASYYRPFESFAPLGPPDLIFTDPAKVLCVVFTGGEDVDPSVYGRKPNSKTSANLHRDQEEIMFYNKAYQEGIPMAGICRGAQFLCVMNGGQLVQHVTGHSCAHQIATSAGHSVEVTSTHHQMQLPPPNAKILAWAEPRRSHRYEGGDGELLHPEVEYEGVYYPDSHALGMQWHPEAMSKDTAGFQYTRSLIRKLLQKRLAA